MNKIFAERFNIKSTTCGSKCAIIMSLLEGLMACQLHMNSLQNPWVSKRRLLTLLILLYEHINMKALKRDPILEIFRK